jgi:hypothetical protein
MNPRTVLLAATTAILLTTAPAEARRHHQAIQFDEFCGARYCGATMPTRNYRQTTWKPRTAKRWRSAKGTSKWHREARTYRQAKKRSVAPVSRTLPGVLASFSAPIGALCRQIAATRNLFEAFRDKIADFAEPVRPGYVAVKTRTGRRAVVAQAQAWRFAGFLRDLEAIGYRINDLGGYAYRRIAGSRRMSQHSKGLAIDVNQLRRDVVSVPMDRRKVSAIASTWGLKSGGDWRNPDLGHFEVARTERGRHSRVRYASAR